MFVNIIIFIAVISFYLFRTDAHNIIGIIKLTKRTNDVRTELQDTIIKLILVDYIFKSFSC